MKKKIVYLLCFLALAWSVNSCNAISKTCKTCKKVYYVGSTVDHEDSSSEYCGTDLITIEATGPVTVGNYTVKWECN